MKAKFTFILIGFMLALTSCARQGFVESVWRNDDKSYNEVWINHGGNAKMYKVSKNSELYPGNNVKHRGNKILEIN